MFLVPHRPKQLPFLSGQLGVMGLFLNGRLGVPYETDIGIELYDQILHIEVPLMVPMFDVFHVPHMHVNCSHSTVAIWE